VRTGTCSCALPVSICCYNGVALWEQLEHLFVCLLSYPHLQQCVSSHCLLLLCLGSSPVPVHAAVGAVKVHE